MVEPVTSNSLRLSTYDVSPIIEQKTFLQKDSYLSQSSLTKETKKPNYLKTDSIDDDLSVDSWETISNEDLDNLMEFSQPLLSPDTHQGFSPDSHYEDNSPLQLEQELDLYSQKSANSNESTKVLQIYNTSSSSSLLEPEEETEEMKLQKREKNRLAARRCRQKQKDRIDYLEKDVKEIETANYEVENEIHQLQKQLRELRDILMNHDCVMQAPRLSHYRQRYMQNIPTCW